jgi:multimeric flavodoxin WrbA
MNRLIVSLAKARRAAMRITAIVGSPRTQGHGAAIIRALLDQLGESGKRAKIYELNQLSYRGCQACLTCKTTSEVCAAEDDLSPVLEDVRLSDLVVISAPVFMGEVSAQAKGLLDRFYSYLKPDFRTNPGSTRLPPGKRLVFIMTQGNPDEQSYGAVLARHLRTFGLCGFKEVYPIIATGVRAGSEARVDAKTMARVAETAEAILASLS